MSNVKTEIEKPHCLKEDHLLFLDALRKSGKVNMFGASPSLIKKFHLSRDQAADVLKYWMRTFGERHKEQS